MSDHLVGLEDFELEVAGYRVKIAPPRKEGDGLEKLRGDVGNGLERLAHAVDGAYRMRWVDFANATGTPSFDSLQLNFGWKF